jgi:hypothetical protein
VTTLAGVTTFGSTNGEGTNAKFSSPSGVEITADGLSVLIADSTNWVIREVVISTGSAVTFAGSGLSAGFANGVGSNAKFNSSSSVSISADYALVADTGNHQIRRLSR